MAIYRNFYTILDVDTATSESKTGDTYQIRPSDADSTKDASQIFAVFISLTQSDGDGSTSRTDLYIESSTDGVNWVVVGKATQLTADGEEHEMKTVEVGPYIRARTILSGTAPNHTAKVDLASTSPFSIVKK